jgi:hypothetical protein
MEEEEKPKSQIPTLIGVLALLVSILLIIFFVVPKTSEVKTLANEVAGKKQELELGKQKITAIREAIKLIASAKKEVDALNVSIPQAPSADEALAQIQAIASQSEVKIIETTIGSAADGYQEIAITMSGPYVNIVTYLDKMQNNLRPVKVNAFNLYYNEGTSDITMSIDLVFPYLSVSEEEGEGSGVEESSGDLGESEGVKNEQ